MRAVRRDGVRVVVGVCGVCGLCAVGRSREIEENNARKRLLCISPLWYTFI